MAEPASKALHLVVDDWHAARVLFDHLQNFVFRGHAGVGWTLSSSLERVASRLNAWNDIIEAESLMLEQFQRRAHHYLTTLPGAEDRVEWLAMIQHYGGPTRLLDFTRSPYVAAFFAMENADNDAAVWAISEVPLWLQNTARSDLPRNHHATIDTSLLERANQALIAPSGQPGILMAEPFLLNERMAVQQGTFLMPLSLSSTFDKNMESSLGVRSSVVNQMPAQEFDYSGHNDIGLELAHDLWVARLVKIVLPRRIHAHAMLDLAAMNVSSTSLFGGLDGFARSLPGILRQMDRLHYDVETVSDLLSASDIKTSRHQDLNGSR